MDGRLENPRNVYSEPDRPVSKSDRYGLSSMFDALDEVITSIQDEFMLLTERVSPILRTPEQDSVEGVAATQADYSQMSPAAKEVERMLGRLQPLIEQIHSLRNRVDL